MIGAESVGFGYCARRQGLRLRSAALVSVVAELIVSVETQQEVLIWER